MPLTVEQQMLGRPLSVPIRNATGQLPLRVDSLQRVANVGQQIRASGIVQSVGVAFRYQLGNLLWLLNT